MKIIIDVMSGDNAPEEIIKGVFLAHEEYPHVDMVMTGNKYIIEDYCREAGLDLDAPNISIVHTESVITMEDPALSVGLLAPYAIHAHAKDFHWKSGMDINPGDGWFKSRGGNYLRGAIIGHGDAKAFQSIQILKNAGYDGFVTIEFEGMEDNLVGLEAGLANLKRFIEA